MKDLKIEYRKLGLKRVIKRAVPSSFNELSKKQIISIAKLFRKEIDEAQFFSEFFSLKKNIPFDAYSIYKISELIDFIGNNEKVIADRFIINSLPGNLYSPGERLKGMSLQQFMFVDTYFSKYIKTENEDDLNMFIAYLYIKKHECFVLPEHNNYLFLRKRKVLLELSSQRLKKISEIDINIKYAVFLNFIFIKKWISRSFTLLFPEEDEEKGNKKNVSPKWLDIFDSFVGDNIVDIDKYSMMPVTTAFRLMNRRIKEGKKINKI